MVLNLVFASNSVVSYFFFLFSIIDLYRLIPEVTTQIFIAFAEFAILTGIPSKEPKQKMKHIQ